MLRLFGPDCPAAPFDPASGPIPDCAVWIDLLNPTPEEDKAAETFIGMPIPTRDEMVEIEPSSRLYERRGAQFMTMSVLYGIDENDPGADPVSFILTDRHLVSVRYVDPRPFVVFAENAYAEPDLVADPLRALARILDAVIDRQADVIEEVGRQIERVSRQIFQRRHRGADRLSTVRLEALIMRIGEIQNLLARLRETSLSTSRLLTYVDTLGLAPTGRRDSRHFESLIADSNALADHTNFLTDNLTFLLDAALGLIGVEQNVVMKIWSVVAVVLMPPTLVAGIYGMNFEHMPELKWLMGYPMALLLMLASAIIPFWLARRKGWL